MLGVIGGQITLFKGLEQMQTLAATVDDYTVGGLALVFVVKLVALVVAGTSGFRGGRIFPSVFIAVALGLFIYELFPQVPEAVAISASLIGILARRHPERLDRAVHGRAARRRHEHLPAAVRDRPAGLAGGHRASR